MNILLIGSRGSGKSTVGPLLAVRMKKSFIDLDECVLATFAQRSVVEVWGSHGEQAWRNAEIRCLLETLNHDDCIVALGGGTPMIPAAQDAIEAAKRRGKVKVVYLRCSVSTLVKRLRDNPGDRPPLSDSPIETEIAKTLAAREPTYLALADVIAEADRPLEKLEDGLAKELA
jgi:shikimate kinase